METHLVTFKKFTASDILHEKTQKAQNLNDELLVLRRKLVQLKLESLRTAGGKAVAVTKTCEDSDELFGHREPRVHVPSEVLPYANGAQNIDEVIVGGICDTLDEDGDVGWLSGASSDGERVGMSEGYRSGGKRRNLSVSDLLQLGKTYRGRRLARGLARPHVMSTSTRKPLLWVLDKSPDAC